MSRVGEQLRLGREHRNLTLQQVAEATKMRSDHVRALEEGDYNVFAAPVYIRGFVRSYASLIKLESGPLLKQLEEELAGSSRFREPAGWSGGRQGPIDAIMLQLSKINWRIGLVVLSLALAALVALVGYRAWRSYMDSDPLADLGPGMYEPAQTNDGLVLPLPQAP